MLTNSIVCLLQTEIPTHFSITFQLWVHRYFASQRILNVLLYSTILNSEEIHIKWEWLVIFTMNFQFSFTRFLKPVSILNKVRTKWCGPKNAEILWPAQSVQLSALRQNIKNQWCSYIKKLLKLKLQPTSIKTNTTNKVIIMWQETMPLTILYPFLSFRFILFYFIYISVLPWNCRLGWLSETTWYWKLHRGPLQEEPVS